MTPPPPGTTPAHHVAGSPVAAPFHGVVDLLVNTGDRVEAGQPLAVIEALKMEAALTAPHAGTVQRVLLDDTGAVDGGDVLLLLC